MTELTRREIGKRANAAKIMAAAKELFDLHGFDKVKARELSRHAGLNTIHIYGNWPTMANLYREIYGHPPIADKDARELLALVQAAAYVSPVFNERRDAVLANILPEEAEAPPEPMSEAERWYDAQNQAADQHRKMEAYDQ